jgi:acyl dehydratase
MDLDAVIKRAFPPIKTRYSAKDTILYALGVGAGADPVDMGQLRYVYEKGLSAIPSQASVIAFPGAWLTDPALRVDYPKVLHGEQGMAFERPLKPEGDVIGHYEVLAVDDKGTGRGAMVHFEKRLLDAADGGLICRVRSTYALRNDGGCGSWGTPPAPAQALPDRAPDRVIDIPISARLALIYRLSSDYNPIHADPEAARNAGFDRPILHGLATYGIAALAMVEALCDNDPATLTEMFTRFSGVVFPGDTIRLELFEDGDAWRFRARVPDRDVIVLDRGLCRIA